MARIENPIFKWLKSKKAISDNPISLLLWFSPKQHYSEFEETVSCLSDEELKTEIDKYDHNTLTDLTITSLVMAAEVGGAAVVAPHVDSRVIVYSIPAAVIAACSIGMTRGVIRDREKGILQEEIDTRSQITPGTVYSASKEV